MMMQLRRATRGQPATLPARIEGILQGTECATMRHYLFHLGATQLQHEVVVFASEKATVEARTCRECTLPEAPRAARGT